MIKCPNCGGELKYNVNDKVVKCDHCGSTFNPDEQIAKTKTAEENTGYQGKVYNCTQCGANLMTFDETAITFCSYCGSQAMLESKMIQQTNPDFIIPFTIDKDKCVKKFKDKVNKSVFVPNYMKSDLVVEKFRGIYIPYCIYKLGFKGVDKEKGEKYSHRSGDYQYYDQFSVEFNVDAKYEGFSYDLASKFYDKYSEAIPFNEEEKKPFNANYMLGYYADAKDVDSNIYLNQAIEEANADYKKRLLATKEASQYGCSTASIKFDNIDQKVGMFPLYFLAIRSKNQKNINYAVVNGQTGELVTELPVSYTKYLIGSLIMSVIIFFLINSFLVLTPHEVCFTAIIVAMIGMAINYVQAHALTKREKNGDDLGLQFINKGSTEKYKHPYFGFVIAVISMLIPVLILAMNPVHDYYYYGASAIALGLMLLNFYNIVKKHNELVSTKLPQLEKRGGDESA